MKHCQALGSIPCTAYAEYGGRTHGPSTGEMEIGGSNIQSHPQLRDEFEASLAT